MTSDEMMEIYKRITREFEAKGMTVDISIQSLLNSHPEQLVEFTHKLANFLADEMVAKNPDQSRDEIRQMIYDGYREMFSSSIDKKIDHR